VPILRLVCVNDLLCLQEFAVPNCVDGATYEPWKKLPEVTTAHNYRCVIPQLTTTGAGQYHSSLLQAVYNTTAHSYRCWVIPEFITAGTV
jgi:hypothetical protein